MPESFLMEYLEVSLSSLKKQALYWSGVEKMV